VKLRAGSEDGDAVDGASRWSSANTCFGAAVTLEASQTSPETCDHSAVLEKSSVPSTITPLPPARSVIGLPATPEAGSVTCSR
jgi:hypothetical protein